MMDWDTVGDLLKEKLDKRHVKPPPQGKYGEYIEGWHAIAEANRIFGFGGWSYHIVSLDCVWSGMQKTKNGDKPAAAYACRVMVEVDSVTREDVGHGQGFGTNEGEAHESAAKEAVTDALKRTLRTFGNPFGLALYDKTQANVEDSTARLRVEKRAAEIQRQIKNIANAGEYAGFANSIRNEVRDMGVNGFAELAAQISAAMVTKKDELSEKKDAA